MRLGRRGLGFGRRILHLRGLGQARAQAMLQRSEQVGRLVPLLEQDLVGQRRQTVGAAVVGLESPALGVRIDDRFDFTASGSIVGGMDPQDALASLDAVRGRRGGPTRRSRTTSAAPTDGGATGSRTC